MLRPYQIQAVDGIKWAVSQGSTKILLVSPTGAGKTEIVSDFFRAKRGRKLIFTHRTEIAAHIQNVLSRHGVKDVAIHSTYTNPRLWGPADYVFVDEAHHAAAKTFNRIFDKYKSAILIGATATPYRMDGVPIAKLFDSCVFTPNIEELASMHYIAKAEVFTVNSTDISTMKKRAGDVVLAEACQRVREIVQYGEVRQNWDSLAPNKKALLFCTTIQHCKHVEQELRNEGKRVACVYGQQNRAERQANIEDFRNGVLEGLVSCELLTEGVDLPNIGAIILLRPTLSRVKLNQMIGRGLRPDQDCTIIDHAGNFAFHDGILSERPEQLIDAFVRDSERKAVYKDESRPALGNTILFINKVDAELQKLFWIPEKLREMCNVIQF